MGALRAEREVRLAVLFGSTATGENTPVSDVDLLVVRREPDWRGYAALRGRLRGALGTPVDLVDLAQAEEQPTLLADVLREGRVLIDRDGLWGGLIARRGKILAAAAREDEEIAERARGGRGRARAPDARVNPSPGKDQRRIRAILQEIPAVREQLLVAMEEFGEGFPEATFLAAARSPDAHERNRVAVVERLYEVLLNWLGELAARALAEGQRLGMVDKTDGSPWQRLTALGVISAGSAARLQEAKELRDVLGHAYTPADLRALHAGVRTLVEELDAYVVRFARWAEAEGIAPL